MSDSNPKTDRQAVKKQLSPETGIARRNIRRLARSGRKFIILCREEGLRSAAATTLAAATAYSAERLRWVLKRVGVIRTKRGVLYIGYVEGGLGLGQSLRSLISAMSTTSLPISILPFNRGIETRNIGPFMSDRYDTRAWYSVNVIEMATDQIPALEAELGSDRFRDGYNILRTYWELPHAPQAWVNQLKLIDEIWAPTRFVADAFKSVFEGPIKIVPPCIDVTAEGGFDRAHFDIENSRFYFLFSFDYYSRPARKNPLAVVDAFKLAFPDLHEGVGLIIKTTGSAEQASDPATMHAGAREVEAHLAKAAKADERIQVFDRTLERGEMLSLIRQCDCYVSLHRSEGFGLGMAEAMAFGNVVIGTDFSGSTDYLSEETGFPIPCTLRPVRPDEYTECKGQVWAEPDQVAASEAMRRVFLERDRARERGISAAAFIAAEYGSRTVAQTAEIALREILRRH